MRCWFHRARRECTNATQWQQKKTCRGRESIKMSSIIINMIIAKCSSHTQKKKWNKFSALSIRADCELLQKIEASPQVILIWRDLRLDWLWLNSIKRWEDETRRDGGEKIVNCDDINTLKRPLIIALLENCRMINTNCNQFMRRIQLCLVLAHEKCVSMINYWFRLEWDGEWCHIRPDESEREKRSSI